MNLGRRSSDRCRKAIEAKGNDYKSDFQVIASKFPMLTILEVDICVLIKHGFTSMSIGAVLETSDKNIEGHRSRIRHKLQLPIEYKLGTFLSSQK